jgi:GT2 family glycosyltransferase
LHRQRNDQRFEVVLADSSNDGTCELIREEYSWVNLIRLDKQTYPGPARNAAVNASQGEILAFVDADCTVPLDWIDRIIANHKSGEMVVGGAVLNGTPGSYTGTADYLTEFSAYMPHLPPSARRIIPTCNLSLSRAVFEAAGRFEDVNTGEDTLLCHRILELGYTIRFDPSIKIFHHNRVILNQYLINQLSLGFGSASVRRVVPMVGGVLLKHVLMQICIPFIKMVLIGRRTAIAGIRSFLNFLFHAPLIFVGCCFYAVGFARGARAHIR